VLLPFRARLTDADAASACMGSSRGGSRIGGAIGSNSFGEGRSRGTVVEDEAISLGSAGVKGKNLTDDQCHTVGILRGTYICSFATKERGIIGLSMADGGMVEDEGARTPASPFCFLNNDI
jgi:hypothetical protein